MTGPGSNRCPFPPCEGREPGADLRMRLLAHHELSGQAVDAILAAVAAVAKHEERLRIIHTSDGQPAPFCTECTHAYPCLTIRILDGRS